MERWYDENGFWKKIVAICVDIMVLLRFERVGNANGRRLLRPNGGISMGYHIRHGDHIPIKFSSTSDIHTEIFKSSSATIIILFTEIYVRSES